MGSWHHRQKISVLCHCLGHNAQIEMFICWFIPQTITPPGLDQTEGRSMELISATSVCCQVPRNLWKSDIKLVRLYKERHLILLHHNTAYFPVSSESFPHLCSLFLHPLLGAEQCNRSMNSWGMAVLENTDAVLFSCPWLSLHCR